MQALDMAAREGQRDDAVRGAEVDANSVRGPKFDEYVIDIEATIIAP